MKTAEEWIKELWHKNIGNPEAGEQDKEELKFIKEIQKDALERANWLAMTGAQCYYGCSNFLSKSITDEINKL